MTKFVQIEAGDGFEPLVLYGLTDEGAVWMREGAQHWRSVPLPDFSGGSDTHKGMLGRDEAHAALVAHGT